MLAYYATVMMILAHGFAVRLEASHAVSLDEFASNKKVAWKVFNIDCTCQGAVPLGETATKEKCFEKLDDKTVNKKRFAYGMWKSDKDGTDQDWTGARTCYAAETCRICQVSTKAVGVYHKQMPKVPQAPKVPKAQNDKYCETSNNEKHQTKLRVANKAQCYGDQQVSKCMAFCKAEKLQAQLKSFYIEAAAKTCKCVCCDRGIAASPCCKAYVPSL